MVMPSNISVTIKERINSREAWIRSHTHGPEMQCEPCRRWRDEKTLLERALEALNGESTVDTDTALTIASLQAHRDAASDRVLTLKEQLSSAHGEIARLSLERNNARAKARVLESKLATVQDRVEYLDQTGLDLANEREVFKNERNALKAALEDSRARHKRATDLITHLKKEAQMKQCITIENPPETTEYITASYGGLPPVKAERGGIAVSTQPGPKKTDKSIHDRREALDLAIAAGAGADAVRMARDEIEPYLFGTQTTEHDATSVHVHSGEVAQAIDGVLTVAEPKKGIGMSLPGSNWRLDFVCLGRDGSESMCADTPRVYRPHCVRGHRVVEKVTTVSYQEVTA